MAVTVYTRPGCVQCTATERELAKLKIPYELVDLTTDDAAYAFVLSLGYKQAPVVVAHDRHWSGFQPGMISALEGS